jgi:hypothetical protein
MPALRLLLANSITAAKIPAGPRLCCKRSQVNPAAAGESPPLSVVIPARGGAAEAAPAIEALLSATADLGVEIVVVGGSAERPPSEAVRVVPMPVDDILALRRRAIVESSGRLIAIGEDHAVPRRGWCEAVIRAHREHPEAEAIVGCLVNATGSTLAGRANFLAFAAEWQPPLTELPTERPPPASTLSLKRRAIAEIGRRPPGWFEAELLPALCADGRMVADERIVVDHFQDHGVGWSIRNAFDGSRAAYGYLSGRLEPRERRRVARWTVDGIARRVRRQARGATAETRMGPVESALVTTIGVANGLGGTVGTLFGPGRSADRVA